MPNITVSVTCAIPHWVTVDATDVPNNPGNVVLAVGSHALIWGVMGSPGDSFSAELKDGARVVCTVSNWTIPHGSSGWSGDAASFNV